ncbi:MAG: erpA 1 [Chloroflexi bacterium]|jgi:iron-sulfur cluster assembly accessory protein|nr:erpA 1 [Chloroflexota bacterium]
MSTPAPSHRPPTLLWTSDAVEAIRALRVEEGRPGAAFRVDLRLGGCQGFKVYFELDAVNGDDVVFEAAPDVSIAVQQDGLAMLDGGILDYESSHRGRGFRLANPAAKSACGCGQAFYADFSDHEPDAVATAE